MINNQNIGVLSEKVARLESDVNTLALPPVETTDEGKVLIVSDTGTWEAADAIPEVVNALDSTSETAALSAAQGKALNDKIENISTYSTTEHRVGTWINGKPLYESIVSCGTLPNNTTKTTAHNIAGISKVVGISGYAFNGTDTIPFPYFNAQNDTVKAGIYANATNIVISTGSLDMSAYTESYVTLRYIKAND